MFLCFLISYLLNSKVLLFASSCSWVPWELTACVESSSRWHFRAKPGIISKLNGHVYKCQGEENFSSLLLGSVVRPCSVQDDVEGTLLFECKISECERSWFVLLSPELPYLPICSTGTKYYWWRTNSRLSQVLPLPIQYFCHRREVISCQWMCLKPPNPNSEGS